MRILGETHGQVAWRIAVPALAFRVISAVLAFFANVALPAIGAERFAPVFGTPNAFWDTFARFDSGWYYQIARYGYRFVAGGPSVGVGKPGKIAYFPVYPLLMRGFGRLFGDRAADVYLGGIAVSWVAFTLAMIALYHLADLDLRAHRAWRAVLLITIFPFAFFFGVVYSESVFLLFTVTSFYFFRTRRWVLGGLCGGIATATRVNGILMLPALAWVAWRSATSDAHDRLRAVAGLVLVTAGLGAYSFYIYRLTGNPLEWARSIQQWGYHPGGTPWPALVRLVHALVTHPFAYLTSERVAPYDALNGVTAIFVAVATPFVWWRLGAAYGLFMAANLWLPLSSGQYEGLGRYCSVMFPVFIWLAGFRSRAVFISVVLVFAMLYPLCLAAFVKGQPLF